MTFKPKFDDRRTWLGLALMLTVAAALWPLPDERSEHHRRARHAHREAASGAFQPLRAGQDSESPVVDLFPSQSWTAPPPALQASAPKPVVVTPPLPFTYSGRYAEGGSVTVYLSDGNQFIRAKQGDRIAGNYRVDAVSGSAIQFTYLPTGEKQILNTGELLP